ncbi:hypothetical protein ACIBAC_00470 [Streptomyces sp. NPDC051362]|uniref:hypothetical protein n=1 Tax=Streptomyces sp. NPDC051362 TaxID=3365651 RepID=UPI0037BA5BA2
MRTMFGRADKGAERLQRALEGGPVPHDNDTRLAVAAAGALVPGHTRSPERIQQTHDAAMAAFMRTLNPLETRDNAGTDDDSHGEVSLHLEEIELPGGGELVVSDIEEITPERLQTLAAAMAEVIERRAKDHQP